MSNKNYKITPDQFMLLQGFMLFIWNKNHGDDVKTESKFDENSFWATQLDAAGICWYVQNTAAYVMEKRENGWKYFRNLLKEKDIQIEEPKPDNLITAEAAENETFADPRPFKVFISQNSEVFGQECYGTETDALERIEDINRLYTNDRKLI